MVKAMDFEFDTRVPRDSPDMTLKNFFEKWGGQGHVTPSIFWALNANSSKPFKATDFKFDTHVSRGNPDMTLKFFSKKNFLKI